MCHQPEEGAGGGGDRPRLGRQVGIDKYHTEKKDKDRSKSKGRRFCLGGGENLLNSLPR